MSEHEPPYLVGVTDAFPGGNDDDLVEWAFEAGIQYQAWHSKPRIITTAEELDGLAVESVVRSARGTIFENANFHGDPEFPFWLTPGVNHEYAGIALALPATVLYEPTA